MGFFKIIMLVYRYFKESCWLDLTCVLFYPQFDDLPCHIFTSPGHKATPGPANDYDGSCQVQNIVQNI